MSTPANYAEAVERRDVTSFLMSRPCTPMPTRPVLRYHGGKWELAKWIIAHLPPHHVYVEPFGGAASVLLQKPRAFAEVYNDLDGDVVNLFRVLRTHPRELQQLVRSTPFARAEYLEAFSETRDPIERARRTLVRSHMGHAGAATHGRTTGFRGRTINRGVHPATQWWNLPEHLEAIIERLRGVVVEQRDGLAVIDGQDDPRTLFYIDPPYVMASRDDGEDYRHELTDADHEALADKLAGVKGMVVLSGYHSELYDRLFGAWHRVEREALAEKAKVRTEVLWFNPAASAALDGGLLFGAAG